MRVFAAVLVFMVCVIYRSQIEAQTHSSATTRVAIIVPAVSAVTFARDERQVRVNIFDAGAESYVVRRAPAERDVVFIVARPSESSLANVIVRADGGWTSVTEAIGERLGSATVRHVVEPIIYELWQF